jgi:hypothetical protein
VHSVNFLHEGAVFGTGNGHMYSLLNLGEIIIIIIII